jgi:alpha-glucosidase (family GH31 glycosyl hydrolase)
MLRLRTIFIPASTSHAAGAFYTFVRNHNTFGTAPQELYRWPAVAAAARNALQLRYTFLPYLYACFARAHRHGGTVLRPLFWESPMSRLELHARAQWLLGRDVMVAPVLEQGAQSRNVTIPGGQWLCWAGCSSIALLHAADDVRGASYSGVQDVARGSAGSSIARGGADTAQLISGPAEVAVSGIALDMVPLLVRSGAVIPLAQLPAASAQASRELLTAEQAIVSQPVRLLIALQKAQSGVHHLVKPC